MGRKLELDVEQVIAAYRSGGSLRAAAATLGCTRKVVRRILSAHGLVTKGLPPARKLPPDKLVLEMAKTMTQEEIAKSAGCSQTCVGRILRKYPKELRAIGTRHRKRSRRWKPDQTSILIETYHQLGGVSPTARALHTNKATVRRILRANAERLLSQSEAQSGSRNWAWKGGRNIDGDGYVRVYLPSHPHATKAGYVLEHRLTMEEKLGRYLRPGEVVHHRDKNKLNNNPANLILYARNADHLRQELKGRRPKWTKAGYARMCSPRKMTEQGLARIREGVRRRIARSRMIRAAKSDALVLR